jgi:cyclophilin family peptidyl-prolyl cis-trans isomerase
VTLPAGKSLILPVTATSPAGRPLVYSATSSTSGIAVILHTNNPFWQLTVAQAAPSNAPGAYQTPFRGGLATVTNVGAMTFMLFPEYAPHTVNVFQGLTTSGFYNSNTIFHRVITNFVIQGGDPLTNGLGGLVFQYNDEFDPQAIFSGNGQLALANSGKNTDGSQFFVTVGPQRYLDFGYTLLGQLVRGFAVLTNIDGTAVDANSRPFADEIILQASYVTNTTDTVLTLTATNVPGVNGTIKVIADDTAGGRATNTFTATIAADSNSNNNPIIYPGNLVTNLVSPANRNLTNIINATELDDDALYWFLSPADSQSSLALTNVTGNTSNSRFQAFTYNVTNQGGQLQFVLPPTKDYSGPVNIYFDVSYNSQWNLYQQYGFSLPAYDEQLYTFVFGDTPIIGQSNVVTVLAGAPFTNSILATFTNGVPGSAATNFTASINWGDDTITGGSIATNASGQKVVQGAHWYTHPGSYPVYVRVQSGVGASCTVLSFISVISAPPQLSLSGSPTWGTNGFSFTVQLPAALAGSAQFSTNLVDWKTLATFPGTNAVVTIHDPAALGSATRYYRVAIP